MNKQTRVKLIMAAVLTAATVMTGCGVGGADKATDGSAVIPPAPETYAGFTERDLSGEYDAEGAKTVTLTDTLTITEPGVYILTGTLEDGQIIVEADKSDKVQLVLSGVDVTASGAAALYVKSADKVFVTLAEGTENRLASKGEFSPDESTGETVNVDGAVFSRDDITFNGNGSLTVECGTAHGIVSKDDLKITGGVISVTAASHSLSGKDGVYIDGGKLTLNAGKDGIHSSNDEDEDCGRVMISGGDITIECGDDGIHAETDVIISSGTLTISDSHEGVEGKTITVSGGDIDVTSSDDGFNASDGSGDIGGFGGGRPGGPQNGGSESGTVDVYISISGGHIRVNAGGDGLDSNGALYVSGGETYVDGPTNSGNGALDYGTDAVITGGTVVAVGASGMAENFGASSTQGSIMYSANGLSGKITLRDSAGNVLAEYEPSKSFSSIVVSAPGVTEGETYTLDIGGDTVEIKMTSMIYGEGSGFGRPGGFGGGPGGDPGGGFGGGRPGRR